MAVRESRRIEYINVVLREHRLRKVEMTPLGLRLELSIDAAGECYQIATSADRRPNIRTLTHLLPRKTRDPLVLGFKHKTRGDIVIHLVRLPVEILECGIRMQAKQGIVVLVQRLRQLLIDLQPIRESSLLSGRSRRIGIYNSTELIAAARHHAREWGFNPNSLVKAYAEIGVQQPRLRQNPQVLAAPALPPPVAPPMLPLREDPPELLIHYNDFRPIACDDDSCPPITWDWALPEFTTVGCDDEEDGGNDEEQLFPPAAVGMFWDQLESHQTEDVWMGSLGEVSGNLSDEEYLEHFDWLDEAQLSDLP